MKLTPLTHCSVFFINELNSLVQMIPHTLFTISLDGFRRSKNRGYTNLAALSFKLQFHPKFIYKKTDVWETIITERELHKVHLMTENVVLLIVIKTPDESGQIVHCELD